MKQTKYFLKAFLLAIAIATTGTAMAQVDVGFRAGLNLSNLTVKDGNGNRIEGAKLTPGFHAGVTFDIPIAEEFAIQPGALFSMKGAKLTGDADGYLWGDEGASYPDEYTRLNTYNLEVPINFLYTCIGKR